MYKNYNPNWNRPRKGRSSNKGFQYFAKCPVCGTNVGYSAVGECERCKIRFIWKTGEIIRRTKNENKNTWNTNGYAKYEVHKKRA